MRSNPASETDTVSTGPHVTSAAGVQARRAARPSHSSTRAISRSPVNRPALPSDGRPGAVTRRLTAGLRALAEREGDPLF